MPRSPWLVMTGDPGQRFCKRGLDRLPPTGKIRIALWQGPQTVHVIGKDNPDIDMERRAGAHLPSAVTQRIGAVPSYACCLD
jgi:hypothetical protein